MPFSHKTSMRQLRVLKCLARQIIRGLDYRSRLSCSDSGSVYIHSFYKINNSCNSYKLTTRISYHKLHGCRVPDLDIIFIGDCPDDKFVTDCIKQINDLIAGRIEDGAQESF
jgi:hypothetical protein